MDELGVCSPRVVAYRARLRHISRLRGFGPVRDAQLAEAAQQFTPPRPAAAETVVLPTSARKTVLAFIAIEQAPVRTLVVVPTIELLRRWRDGLIERAGIPADLVGVLGGGERSQRQVTVMAYASASMPRRDLSEFGLLIVDEVRHLPAPTYRTIVGKTDNRAQVPTYGTSARPLGVGRSPGGWRSRPRRSGSTVRIRPE